MPNSSRGAVHGKDYEIGVVGGGIVGTATALALAERGIKVFLCEKGELGAEQTSRALGWVRSTERDPRDLPLAIETRRHWQRLEGDAGYRQCGLLLACVDQSEVEARSAWLDVATPFGVDTQFVTAERARALAPHLLVPLAGGLYSPLDGRAEPGLVAPTIAAAAVRRGAVIATDCAARGIETKAGRVSAIVTERGVIACQAVVVAGGVWSALFCQRFGVAVPVLAVESFAMRTSPVQGPEISVFADGVGLRRTLGGGYVVGTLHRVVPVTVECFRWFRNFLPVLAANRNLTGFKIFRPLTESLTMTRRWRMEQASPFEVHRVRNTGKNPWEAEIWRRAQSLFSTLRGATVAERWGGVIDVTPDGLPIISPVERIPGLYLASGFSGGGLGTGFGAGYLIADLICGDRPRVDPSAYRLSRFFDGSILRFAKVLPNSKCGAND